MFSCPQPFPVLCFLLSEHPPLNALSSREHCSRQTRTGDPGEVRVRGAPRFLLLETLLSSPT